MGTPVFFRAIVGNVTKAKKRKKQKRVPKKETPVIRENPADALARLLIIGKAEFDAAHEDGMAALKRHDYDTFTKAIHRERKVIDSVGAAIRRVRKRGKP